MGEPVRLQEGLFYQRCFVYSTTKDSKGMGIEKRSSAYFGIRLAEGFRLHSAVENDVGAEAVRDQRPYVGRNRGYLQGLRVQRS